MPGQPEFCKPRRLAPDKLKAAKVRITIPKRNYTAIQELVGIPSLHGIKERQCLETMRRLSTIERTNNARSVPNTASGRFFTKPP